MLKYDIMKCAEFDHVGRGGERKKHTHKQTNKQTAKQNPSSV
jgi:hypothetical protein